MAWRCALALKFAVERSTVLAAIRGADEPAAHGAQSQKVKVAESSTIVENSWDAGATNAPRSTGGRGRHSRNRPHRNLTRPLDLDRSLRQSHTASVRFASRLVRCIRAQRTDCSIRSDDFYFGSNLA
jgi:hypothetical protein